jgi:ribose 5-phosphate isomerase B
MKVYIGSDHAGYQLKNVIFEHFSGLKEGWEDFGTFSDDSADYPDFAHKVAKAVEGDEESLGVLICGSANGVAMVANKHQKIRCAVCWNQEIAQLARRHNDANIIALPARFISTHEALEMVKLFLGEVFEGGRHAGRVNKIACG